ALGRSRVALVEAGMRLGLEEPAGRGAAPFEVSRMVDRDRDPGLAERQRLSLHLEPAEDADLDRGLGRAALDLRLVARIALRGGGRIGKRPVRVRGDGRHQMGDLVREGLPVQLHRAAERSVRYMAAERDLVTGVDVLF